MTFHGDGMTDSVRKIGFARVEFDASGKNLEETDDLLVVKNVVLSRQGIFPYGSRKAFKSGDELEAGSWTLEGAWLVAYDHVDTPFLTDRDDIRGRTKNVQFDKDKAAIVGDLEFFKKLCTQPFLSGIKSGALKDVSVGFISDDLAKSGKFGDEAYDYVQTRFMFGHVAVALAEGRCPSPFCGIALDSVFNPDLETANYVHVQICETASGTFPPRIITFSEKEGILAVVGKSDPAKDAEVLRYLFSKAKGWTLEKAQAWTKEHNYSVGDSVDPARVIVAKPADVEPPTPGPESKPCGCPLIAAREEVERARRLLGSR